MAFGQRELITSLNLPVIRPPLFPSEAVLLNPIAGHGWTNTYGHGTLSDDTVDFIKGDRSLKLVTDGANGNCNMRKTALAALDMTGKAYKLWIKISDVAKISGNTFLFYASSDNFASAWYTWNLASLLRPNATAANGLNNKWMCISLSLSNIYNTTGAPNWAAMTAYQIALKDDSTGTVTFWLGGLSHFTSPAAGIVSLTFDDGWVSQFTEASKKMGAYSFRGTAYVSIDKIGSSAEFMTLTQLHILQDLLGWDISAHHSTDFTTISVSDLIQRLIDIKLYLQNNGFVKGLHDVAYPSGGVNPTILPYIQKYFRSGRTIISSFNGSYPPTDPFLLKVKLVVNTTTTASIATAVTNTKNNHDWLILVFHKLVAVPTVSTEYSITNFDTVIDDINTQGVAVKTVADVLNGGS